MFKRALFLLAVVLLSPAPAPSVVAAAQPSEARTFRELGYTDRTVRTIHGSLSYSFAVPGGRAPLPGSELELVISHSPLLAPDRSTVSVIVNGQTTTSASLTAENHVRGRVRAPLPVEGFSHEGVFVQVQFTMRLTRDECEDAQHPALWATVHDESRLTLTSRLPEQGLGLEDLPALFGPWGSVSADAPVPLALVLPPAPSPAELDAAGILAFQYGRWLAATRQDPLLQVAITAPKDRPSILVGTGGSLPASGATAPLRWDGQAFTTPGGMVPADQGVLAIGGSDPPSLLVSGATPKAVREAAVALARPEYAALLRGEYIVVSGAWPGDPTPPQAWQFGAASFAQLGAGRIEFFGPGEHTLLFAHERPAGWMLEKGSTLELVIESTPALRAETSSVSVSVNGIDAGAHELAPPAGDAGRYRFVLPVDELNTSLQHQPLRRLALEVRLHLDVQQSGCRQSAPAGVWASILPSSTWRLPHREYRGLDLGRFPAGLVRPEGVRLSVVVPDQPSEAELTAGLQVLAAAGRWSALDIKVLPRLVTTTGLSNRDRDRDNLVLIGGPDRNTVGAAAARQNRSLFKEGDPPAYRLNGSGRRGVLHLARSPWGRGRTLLILSGDDPDGLRLASRALAQSRDLAQLRGRTAVLVGDLPPQTTVEADPPERPPGALAPRVENRFRERLKPWQVAGAVLLTGFVATVSLTLIRRSRGRGAS